MSAFKIDRSTGCYPCPKCGSQPHGEADADGYDLKCCGISTGLQNSDYWATETWNSLALKAKRAVQPFSFELNVEGPR